MNLNWKWVGIGTLVMLALSIVAGLILGALFSAQLQGVTDPAQVSLTGSQMAVAAALNFFAFVVGGFIVGKKSAERTILEPAIAAAVAVAVGLLLSGNFTAGNLLAGGVVPFLAGLLGGWLGERRPAQGGP